MDDIKSVPTDVPNVRPLHPTSQLKIADSLRPATMADIVGQSQIKSSLEVYMRSAKRRGRALDHVFFAGPPGLGKTTFASVIAMEMCDGINFDQQEDARLHRSDGPIKPIHDEFCHSLILETGPNLDKERMLSHVSRIISSDEHWPPVILFIDEIHALDKEIMTVLLPLLEDRFFLGINVPEFTCIGATTDPAKLPAPLRDRFGITYQLWYYSPEEIATIIRKSMCTLLHKTPEQVSEMVNFDDNIGGHMALMDLAKRSRGVPRTANNLLKRTLDYALDAMAIGETDVPFNPDIVTTAMRGMDIDKNGLNKGERTVLKVMLDRYGQRPVGIRAISSAVGEGYVTIEEVIEPNLVRLGFVNRESRGRTLTPEGVVVAALELEGQTEY